MSSGNSKINITYMNFSLVLNDPKLTAKYYKCITRVDAGSDGYEYALHSFAKPEFSAFQVYQLFFGSVFKKEKGQKILDAYEDSLSIFFVTFCRLVFFNFLLSQEQKDQVFAYRITQEMFNTSIQASLARYVRIKMENMAEEFKHLMNGGTVRTFKEVQQIWKLMDENVEVLINLIESQAFSLQSEHIPPAQFLHDKKCLVLYVKRLFDKIRNIHILRRSKKRQMLEVLYSEYCGIFSMRIPYLQDSKDKKDSKGMECKICLTKNTTQIQPIIMVFPHYLKHFKDINVEIKYAIARDVVKLFRKFFRETKKPFPNLRLKSLLFDQRKAEPIFDQVYLIFDGLGMSGNTNTVELQIALNSTPTILQYEKCHLEEEETVKWLMVKKYYKPIVKGVKEEDENRSIDLIDQDQKEVREKDILENIHVWRLLCVIYSIFNTNSQHSQLSAKIYADKYNSAPYFRKQYLIALKEAYSSVKSGRKSIPKLLNLERLSLNNQPPVNSTPKQFNFTIKEVCDFFQIQDDDDSMLQMLKHQSFCAQLFLRICICKEISNITITNPYFSLLLNIKKYIIGYFSLASEFFYQVAFKAWLQQRQRSARKNFMSQSTAYKNINFKEQRQRMVSQTDIIAKKLLEDYMSRTDISKQFLVNNPKIVQLVKLINGNLKVVNSGELELNQKETMFRLDFQNKEYVNNYMVKLKEVKSVACKSFDLCIEMLEVFCIQEIDAKKGRPEEFHKVKDILRDGKHNRQLANIATQQLILLIQTYTRLNHRNWKTFERFVPQALIDRKNMFTKYAKRSVSSLQKEQIDQIQSHLNLIQAKIREYSIEKLCFGLENSWQKISK